MNEALRSLRAPWRSP